MHTRSIPAIILPIGAGILAGVVTSVAVTSALIQNRQSPTPDGVAATAETDTTRPALPSRAATGSDPLRERLRLTQLAAMERRLEQVETAVSDRDQPASAADAPPLDPAEENQRIAERRAAAIDAHHAEPIDVPWAGATGATLTQDLTALTAKAGFGVVGVECRTSSCLATVEWPSYQAASDSFPHLLTGVLNVNCERQVLLPEPEPGAASAPYRTTMVLEHCARTPAGGL